MWFSWDGTHLRSTTMTRRKHRSVTAEPRVAVSINDPEQPNRYLEVRGTCRALLARVGCRSLASPPAQLGPQSGR